MTPLFNSFTFIFLGLICYTGLSQTVIKNDLHLGELPFCGHDAISGEKRQVLS